jgi:hypothetical protein
MLSTLFFLCLVVGILTIFADDWLPIVKRYFQIPVIKIGLPLILVSWLVMTFSIWIIKGLWVFWAGYVIVVSFLVEHTPAFATKMVIYQALIIAFLSLIPTIFARVTAKPFRPFSPPYWGSILLWIGLAVLISLLEGSV